MKLVLHGSVVNIETLEDDRQVDSLSIDQDSKVHVTAT